MGLSALLCRFGRHRPQDAVRWNQGYAFTRCERCGRDLVRSMIGGWQVPIGHRVVWREPEPPRAPEPPPPLTGRPLTAGKHRPPPRKTSPFDFSDFDDEAALGLPPTVAPENKSRIR